MPKHPKHDADELNDETGSGAGFDPTLTPPPPNEPPAPPEPPAAEAPPAPPAAPGTGVVEDKQAHHHAGGTGKP